MGCESDVEADIITKGFMKEDILLICTDGLTNMIAANEIYDMIVANKHDVKFASESLVIEANKRGGYDNISVVLISNY